MTYHTSATQRASLDMHWTCTLRFCVQNHSSTSSGYGHTAVTPTSFEFPATCRTLPLYQSPLKQGLDRGLSHVL